MHALSAVEFAFFRIMRLFRKLPFNILGIGNRKVIFLEYFKDFSKVEAVREIFGAQTDEVLSHKQFMEGKELFDPRYDYVDRPTEIEAYRYTVKEARRLGLSDERIRCYLWTEWMTQEDFKRLAKSVNVSLS